MLIGCRTERLIIKNQKFYDFQINILVSNKISEKSKYEIIHAQVFRTDASFHYIDSFYNYFFFWNKVIRSDHKSNQGTAMNKTDFVYQTVNDSNYSLSFSHLDSLVFVKVKNISDSLKINDFNFLSTIRGFTLKKNRNKYKD